MRASLERRQWFSALSAIVALVGCCAVAAAEFPCGVVPDSPETRRWADDRAVERIVPLRRSAVLPAAVKNLDFLPRVKSQTLPNCGAFAPTYYVKTYLEARERGWGNVDPVQNPERAMSPGIAYVFGQSDVYGGSLGGAIRIMCEVGILPFSELPDTYNYDRSTFPSATMLLQAMPFRSQEMVVLNSKTDDGIAAIKEWLADGEIAAFALPISEAMFDYGREASVPGVNQDVVFDLGGALYANHAFTLVGYDDGKTYHDGSEEKQGAFLAVNSWGTTWGVLEPDFGSRGFVWFGYDYFRAQSWETVYSMTPRSSYHPRLVGLVDYSHPYSPQVLMELGGGSRADSHSTVLWPPANPSSNASYLHPLAIDLTSDFPEDSEAFSLRIFNVGAITGLPHPAATGTLNAFHVLPYEAAMQGLAGPLFEPGTLKWNFYPLSRIQSPMLDTEGLPLQTVLLPSFTDVRVGLFDGGEEILDPPLVYGDALFVDLDGSGLPDLVSVAWAETQVFQNIAGTLHKVADHGISTFAGAAAAILDIDRDGRPDIIVTGALDGAANAVRLYRNLGNFQFEELETTIVPVSGSMFDLNASIAVGDYDNDGLEDVALWGFASDSTKHVRVYRNRGNGVFEPAPFALPERHGAQLSWQDVNANGLLDLTVGSEAFLNLGGGMLADSPIGFESHGLWADFTGDGLPDLLRTYRQNVQSGTQWKNWGRLRLYVNQGDGNLLDTTYYLHDFENPRLEAVDYNADGLLDLVSAHMLGPSGFVGTSTPRVTALYTQVAGTSFRNAGFDFLGTSEGAVAFADLKGQGAMDLLTSGYIQTDGSLWERGARLYRSRFAENPLGDTSNTAPSPPTALNTIVQGTGEVVAFLWDHGTDLQTPQDALGYNVRIGTVPGWGNIVSPATCAPVAPIHRLHRVAPDQPGLILDNLRPGIYFWSVRTVDNGMMASEWSAEQTLYLLDGFNPQDANDDGVVDAADLMVFSRLIKATEGNLPDVYDFNTDTMVNQGDLRTLANRLAGSDEDFPGSYTVGPEGGVVELDEMQLAIPAGAITDPVVLTLERVPAAEGLEGADELGMIRINGLPVAEAGELVATFQSAARRSEPPLILVGEDVLARGARTFETRYRFLEPEVLPGGQLRVVLPALPALESGDSFRRGENSYSLNLGILGGYAKYSGPRFSIAFPQAYVGDQVENLMAGFETAHTLLQSTYGFSYAGRTRWPMEVCVRDLGPNEDGAMISSTWGDNYGSIEINTRVMGDATHARATASHEFFHAVQGFYDPRGRLSKAYRMSRHLWLDEASSTWAESLVVPDPSTYVPVTYSDNQSSPYRGIANGITGEAGAVMEFGYGMAPLARFMINTLGQGALLTAYEAILSGADSVGALRAASPGALIFLWYDTFYSDLIESKLYPSSVSALSELQTVVGRDRLFILEATSPTRVRQFPISLTDLAAAPHLMGFRSEFPEPEAADLLAVRYEGEPSLVLQLFKGNNTAPMERVGTVFGMDPIKFTTIADARGFFTTQSRLCALVTNTNDDAPYTQAREGTLSLGLATAGPISLLTNTQSGQAYGRQFPTFESTGVIGAEAISNLQDMAGNNFFHMVNFTAWGGDTFSLDISYQATLGSSSDSWTEGETTYTLSTPGIHTYQLTRADGQGNTIETQDSATGNFTVVLDSEDRDRGFAIFDLRAKYWLAYQVGDGTPSDFHAEWPMAFFVVSFP